MRKSMLAKKFVINTGINIDITVKTNNGSYCCWRNHPHTIELPPPNFIVFLTHWGDKCSPFLHLTNLLPSDPNKWNLDLSLTWTIASLSARYALWRSQNEPFDFYLKGLRHGIWATNFFLFNLRETVFLEIGFPVCSQNGREIDIVVLKRSFKDILTIIRSSRFVVIGGLPVLSFGSSVLALNLLITQ